MKTLVVVYMPLEWNVTVRSSYCNFRMTFQNMNEGQQTDYLIMDFDGENKRLLVHTQQKYWIGGFFILWFQNLLNDKVETVVFEWENSRPTGRQTIYEVPP